MSIDLPVGTYAKAENYPIICRGMGENARKGEYTEHG